MGRVGRSGSTRDFGIGKRLTNLPAEIGSSANRRLLRVQSISHDPLTGADALHTITAPKQVLSLP